MKSFEEVNKSQDEVENSIVHVLAKVLMKLIEANEANGLHFMSAHSSSTAAALSASGSTGLMSNGASHSAIAASVNKFQSSCVPDVTVAAYLQRIRKYAKCSDACFVLALIYIDRVIEMKNIVLSRLNIHRLLIASVQIAAKYLDDLFYNNAYYAKLGGVSTQEMNALELEFLMLIGFSLHVKQEVYEAYFKELRCYAVDKPVAIPSPPASPSKQQSCSTASIPAVVSSQSLADDCVYQTATGNSKLGGILTSSPVGVDHLQPSPGQDIGDSSVLGAIGGGSHQHVRPATSSPGAGVPRKRSSSVVTPPLSAVPTVMSNPNGHLTAVVSHSYPVFHPQPQQLGYPHIELLKQQQLLQQQYQHQQLLHQQSQQLQQHLLQQQHQQQQPLLIPGMYPSSQGQLLASSPYNDAFAPMAVSNGSNNGKYMSLSNDTGLQFYERYMHGNAQVPMVSVHPPMCGYFNQAAIATSPTAACSAAACASGMVTVVPRAVTPSSPHSLSRFQQQQHQQLHTFHQHPMSQNIPMNSLMYSCDSNGISPYMYYPNYSVAGMSSAL